MIKKQLAVAIACALSVAASQSAYSANDVEIVDGAMQTNVTTGSPSFTTTDDSAQLGVDDIIGLWYTTNSVSLSTAELGTNSQLGDISLTGDLSHLGDDRKYVTLTAHNNIDLNGAITGDTATYAYPYGGLSLILNPDSDGLNSDGLPSTGFDGGVVNLNGTVSGHVDTFVNGALEIGSTGTYNLDHSYASLTVDSINVAAGGALNLTKGLLHITSDLMVADAGPLGNTVSLGSGQKLDVDNTLTVDSGASMTLAGGSLYAGEIVNNGSFAFNAGTLGITGAAGMTVSTGGLLGDAVSLVAGQALDVDYKLTVDNAASLAMNGGHLYAAEIVNNGSFAFNAGTLGITGAAGMTVGTGGLLGDAVSLVAGQALYVDYTLTVDNAASLALNDGSLYAGEIVNNGSFALNSGYLYTAEIVNNGSFAFNAGTLSISGAAGMTVGTTGLLGDTVSLVTGQSLYLTNGLTIDAAASLTLDGGDLYTGAITNNGGFIFNSGGLFSKGDLNLGGGGITLNAGSTIKLYDGGVLTAAAGVTLDGGSLSAGAINANLDFISGSLTLNDSNLTVGAGGLLGNTLTLGAGKGLYLNNYTYSSYNSGTQIFTGEKTLFIDAGASVSLEGGTLRVGNINNSGNFDFTSGSLYLDNSGLAIGSSGLLGSDVTLGSGKTLGISGTLTVNAGASLAITGGYQYAGGFSNNGDFTLDGGSLSTGNIANAGTFTLDGGTLSAGNITNTGTFAFTSGTLNTGADITIGAGGLLGENVALSATRSLNATSVNVDSDAVLSVVSGSMDFATLNNGGTVQVKTGGNVSIGDYNSSGAVNNSGTLNVLTGSTVDVVGNYTQTAGLTTVAEGAAINISKPDGEVYTNNGTFTQDAGRTTINGTMTADSVVINGGQLYGSGTVNGDLIMAGGSLNPGNSPGTLEITGDFVLTAAGTLHMEVASDGGIGYLWDQLIVGGSYDIQPDSMVKFSLLDGISIADFTTDFALTSFFYTGTAGSETPIDLATVALFGNAGIYTYDPLLTQWYQMSFDANGAFTGALEVAAVPVPAAVWLFASGLLGLIGVARRRAVAA